MQQRAGVLSCAILSIAMGASALQAQNPLSADTKFWYTTVKGFAIRAAEKMPEANYSFQPAPTVRTFGQIVGHIADDQFYFCSTVKGESKETDIEKTVKTKAELVAKLKEAFSYCDAVYDGFTDAHAAEKVKRPSRARGPSFRYSTSTSRIPMSTMATSSPTCASRGWCRRRARRGRSNKSGYNIFDQAREKTVSREDMLTKPLMKPFTKPLVDKKWTDRSVHYETF